MEGSESREPPRPKRQPSPSPPPAQRPSPPPSPELLSSPWRVSRPLNSEYLSNLKMRVEKYSLPSELKATQARILMLGPVGAGKSSFFNTINNIFQERMTQQGIAGGDTGSLTMRYRQYQVRSLTTGSPLNFRLCDTCGIENNKGPDLVDLNYILEGNVPDGYEFSSTSISSNLKGFIHQPKPQDKVHCVVFLFDANSIKATNQDTWDKLNQLQKRMNSEDNGEIWCVKERDSGLDRNLDIEITPSNIQEYGIPRVIVLTKIDKLLQSADNDVSKVFFSEDVNRAVEYASEKLRVPLGNVMPIKNYENEIDLNDQISCLALQALDRMLGYANDFLVNQLDLMKLSLNTTP